MQIATVMWKWADGKLDWQGGLNIYGDRLNYLCFGGDVARIADKAHETLTMCEVSNGPKD